MSAHPHVSHTPSTICRPQLTFVPQLDPVPLPGRSSSRWTAGRIVGLLAVFLAVAALSVVGAVVFGVLSQTGF